MSYPVIPLEKFEYSKAKKTLQLSTEMYGAPGEFFVESHKTGRVVHFVPDLDNMLENEFYDGEAYAYKPAKHEEDCGIIRAFLVNQW